eukprot:1628950-Alexandrium_andersonii.AAC.1
MHLRRTHAAAQRGRLKQRQHDFQGEPITSSLARARLVGKQVRMFAPKSKPLSVRQCACAAVVVFSLCLCFGCGVAALWVRCDRAVAAMWLSCA